MVLPHLWASIVIALCVTFSKGTQQPIAGGQPTGFTPNGGCSELQSCIYNCLNTLCDPPTGVPEPPPTGVPEPPPTGGPDPPPTGGPDPPPTGVPEPPPTGGPDPTPTGEPDPTSPTVSRPPTPTCDPHCSCYCPPEDPKPPTPRPCSQHGPTCKWLKIQYADGTVKAGRTTLDHPNKAYDAAKRANNTQYWYPLDTWFVPASGSDLEVYMKGQKVADCGGGNFFIPAGTLDTDVEVDSKRSTKYTFYGACTEFTPCVSGQIKDWEHVAQGPFQEGITKEFNVAQHTGTSEVLFSIADTWNTCEQFSVYSDGQELGRTHGPLTLQGDEKFNPSHIFGSDLRPGTKRNAPYVSITHGGFFGTFRLKKGTQKVMVKALNLVEKDVGWHYSYYGWRLDRPCSV